MTDHRPTTDDLLRTPLGRIRDASREEHNDVVEVDRDDLCAVLALLAELRGAADDLTCWTGWPRLSDAIEAVEALR